MKRTILINITNIILATYVAVWFYYAVFNWEVFSIKLNTNAGFSVIGGYPFAFFFLLGFAALLTLKYFLHLNKVHDDKKDKDRIHRIELMEKDIELLKMKEVLFKMQSSELGKSSAHLDALHKKLDDLSGQLGSSTREEIRDADKRKDPDERKDSDAWKDSDERKKSANSRNRS